MRYVPLVLLFVAGCGSAPYSPPSYPARNLPGGWPGTGVTGAPDSFPVDVLHHLLRNGAVIRQTRCTGLARGTGIDLDGSPYVLLAAMDSSSGHPVLAIAFGPGLDQLTADSTVEVAGDCRGLRLLGAERVAVIENAALVAH